MNVFLRNSGFAVFFGTLLLLSACDTAESGNTPAPVVTKAVQGTFAYAGKTASFSVDIPENRAAVAFTGKLDYNGTVSGVKGTVAGTALSFFAANSDMVYQITGTLKSDGTLASGKAVLQVRQSDNTWETVLDINVTPAANVKIDKEPTAVSAIPEQFWGKWWREAVYELPEGTGGADAIESTKMYDEMYITNKDIYSQTSVVVVKDLVKIIGAEAYADLSADALATVLDEITTGFADTGYKVAIDGTKLTLTMNTAFKYDIKKLVVNGEKVELTLLATVDAVAFTQDCTLQVKNATLDMAALGLPAIVYKR